MLLSRDTPVEGLFKLGAEVDMRDRNGDMALAMAARRGLRPAVATLLRLGANPNTRCYRGNSILSRTSKYLMRAKKEDSGRQYAMILSCISLLSDFDAKENPTVYDEWELHRNRAEIPRLLHNLRKVGILHLPPESKALGNRT